MRALLPLSPQEELGPIRDALSQLQMLYARETQGAEGPAPAQDAAPRLLRRPRRGKTEEEIEREKARSKLWTPSGELVGVFGGSGFYRFLDDVEEVAVDTPYGPPSARIRIGAIDGARVAFMPRHGDEHQLPPHRINYRANVWAMRHVGVRRIVGPSACGSLKPELAPGTFVICDQFVDRTQQREATFYDGPQTTHVSAADPYCPEPLADARGGSARRGDRGRRGRHGGRDRRARASPPGPSRAGSRARAGTSST